MPILSVQNLSFSYKNVPLFKGLSLTLKSGDGVLISGANGSGKSTLLSLLAGLETPQQGRVQRLVIPTLYRENSFFYEDRTLAQNISFYEKLTQKKFSSYLDLLGLTPLLQRSILQLSKGEKARALLARAFVVHKNLLLLDEPFAGLDSHYRQVVTTLLEEVLKNNTTLVIASPLGEEVALSGVRKMVLSQGVLIEERS